MTSIKLDPSTSTAYSTTNWSLYNSSRPPYPPSLRDLIYAYRRTSLLTTPPSPPPWHRLVDIGAGNGIATLPFLPDFRIIHLSDPSAHNETSARAFLSSYVTEHNLTGKENEEVKVDFEFSTAKGEEAGAVIGEAKADMVVCGTAAHWMDNDALSASIAHILKPGGTCAVFTYFMPWFPFQSATFNEKFTAIEGVIFPALLESAGANEDKKDMLRKVVERRIAGRGGLDSFPLPAEKFARRRRVYVNAAEGVRNAHVFEAFRPEGAEGKEWGRSRVEEGEEGRVFVESGIDAEAEGWEFEVDKGFVGRFLDSIKPGDMGSKVQGEEDRKRKIEEAWGAWEGVWDEEVGVEGRARMRWPAYVALGTRR